MPAESIPRCPFGSNGDLGSSRLEEQLDGKITPSDAHSKEALYGPGRGTRGTPRITRGRGGWLVLTPWGLSPPILCQLSWRTPLGVKFDRKAPSVGRQLTLR